MARAKKTAKKKFVKKTGGGENDDEKIASKTTSKQPHVTARVLSSQERAQVAQAAHVFEDATHRKLRELKHWRTCAFAAIMLHMWFGRFVDDFETFPSARDFSFGSETHFSGGKLALFERDGARWLGRFEQGRRALDIIAVVGENSPRWWNGFARLQVNATSRRLSGNVSIDVASLDSERSRLIQTPFELDTGEPLVGPSNPLIRP